MRLFILTGIILLVAFFLLPLRVVYGQAIQPPDSKCIIDSCAACSCNSAGCNGTQHCTGHSDVYHKACDATQTCNPSQQVGAQSCTPSAWASSQKCSKLYTIVSCVSGSSCTGV